MRQHLRYGINFCALGDLDDHIAVPGKVRGYAFLDAQCGCYLFEVEVVFGVAQHGQEIAVNACRLVLFQD